MEISNFAYLNVLLGFPPIRQTLIILSFLFSKYLSDSPVKNIHYAMPCNDDIQPTGRVCYATRPTSYFYIKYEIFFNVGKCLLIKKKNNLCL